jgi:hypothetical protein
MILSCHCVAAMALGLGVVARRGGGLKEWGVRGEKRVRECD